MPSHFREWTVPSLPDGAVLEFDSGIIINEIQEQEDGAKTFVISTDSIETEYVNVRLEEGLILQSIPVRGLTVRDAEHTSVELVQIFGDGSYQVDMPIVVSNVYDDVSVFYDIFIAGVMFDTGGIEKEFFSSEFDELGQAVVSFIKVGLQGSACHRTSVFHGPVRIGHFF